jgi:uncharacterized membrane protein YgcG
MKMNLCHGLSVSVTFRLRYQAIHCHNVIRYLGGQVQMLPHNVLHIMEGGMVVMMVIMVMMIVIVVMVVVIIMVMMVMLVIIVMLVILVMLVMVVMVVVIMMIVIVALLLDSINSYAHVRSHDSTFHGGFCEIFYPRNPQGIQLLYKSIPVR